MRSDKQYALKLRLSGRSYGDIRKLLGVPKSTLSDWFSGIALSAGIKEKIEQKGRRGAITSLLAHNKRQTTLAIARAKEARNKAAQEIRNISVKDLMLLGAALYWAEGHKRPLVRNGRVLTSHPVSMTNSDPFLVKLFLRFLREFCKVPEERIKADIRIFRHQNENNLLKYWHKETGIPLSNFRKTYYGISRSSQGKRPFNRLPYGVIQVRVADTRLFHQIMGYIEGIKKFV